MLLALGLMAKAMLVTVPVVFCCWTIGRWGDLAGLLVGCRQAHGRSTPLTADRRTNLETAATWCVWDAPYRSCRPKAFGRSLSKNCRWPCWRAGLPGDVGYASQGAGRARVAPLDRMTGALTALLAYLVQFFAPLDLAVFYPVPAAGNPTWKVILAVLVLAAITAAATRWRKQSPYLFVGWCWYLVMLLPVLGLVPISWHGMADRYTYLPSIGLSLALAWGLARLATSAADRRWALGGAGVAIVLLSALSVRQAGYWRDDLTLWSHSLAVTEDNPMAEIALAEAYHRDDQTEEAIEHYRRATRWPVGPSVRNALVRYCCEPASSMKPSTRCARPATWIRKARADS